MCSATRASRGRGPPDPRLVQVYGKRPFLTAAAEAAIARVRGLDVALALHARSTSGSYGVARAIHREGRAGGFVSLRTPLLPDRTVEPKLRREIDADPGLDRLTLYVDDLDRQRREVQEELLDLIDEGLRDRGRSVPVRLIARLGEGTRLAVTELTRRLSVVAVRLPPLADRADELAAIVAALAEDLAARLGLPSRWIAPEAVRVLAERPWPGDVDDLEVVLSRLLVGTRGSVVTVEDVWEIDAHSRTGASEAAPRPAPKPDADADRAAPSRPSRPTRPSFERDLEIVVTELAHELKNPMVTLKTFTQHLDRLLEDAETRERFVGRGVARLGFLRGASRVRRQTRHRGHSVPRPLGRSDAQSRRQDRVEGTRGVRRRPRDGVERRSARGFRSRPGGR